MTTLRAVLRSLQPHLHPGTFAFVTLPAGLDPGALDAVATVREPEGTSAIVPVERAEQRGLRIALRVAWITLRADTDLQLVGLTAAVAAALAEADIACNVVAGTFHDHLFVPLEHATRAMQRLAGLAAGDGPRV